LQEIKQSAISRQQRTAFPQKPRHKRMKQFHNRKDGTTMRDFREIKVWAKAHLLTLEIYQATATFPREEIYGLTSQLRRASASIGANIAEGFGRGGNAELARFL
jgi:hypothetical protein